jgi:hypothetical protein
MKLSKLIFVFLTLLLANFNVEAQCTTSTVPTTVYGCYYNDAIDAFTLNSVTTTGNYGCANLTTGYVFYSSPVRTLVLGGTYSYSATTGTSGSTPWNEGFAIWIDLNNDGTYASSEILATSSPNTSHSGSITIPTTATVANNIKMRTRCAYGITMAGGNACTGYTYAETEDYNVNLICPTVSTNTSISACVGQTATLTATSDGGTITWYNVASGGTALGTGGSFTTATISGNTSYWVAAEAGSSCTARTQINITAIALPAFSAHPLSTSVCVGGNVNFSVTASNATTYQWQVNTGSGFTNLNNTPPYSNVGTATMTITGATIGMNGYLYRCVCTNGGNCAVNSNAATLTVNSNTTVTNNPNNATACTGTNVSFSVTATGGSLTYQWQVDQGSGFNNLSNGAPYSNVTNATMNITGVTAGLNGYQYRCVVTGACPPATSVNSGSATLTVVSPPVVTANPINDTTCVGDNASFSVTATGTSLNYQWQVNQGFGFFNIMPSAIYSNVTTSTLNITGATAGMNNYQYRCVVSRPGCASVNSGSAVLLVRTLPNITTQPTGRVLCAGANSTIGLNATGSQLTYQWQVDNGTGIVNVVNGGVYGGATTNTLTLTGVTASMSGYQFRCVVSGYCTPPDTSINASLTVNVPPAITSQPHDSSICANDNATFSTTATGSSINYSWEVDNGTGWAVCGPFPPYSGATTATLTITGATVAMNGYKYRCQVAGVCNPLAYTNQVVLAVNSFPVVTGVFHTDTICEATNTYFAVTATGAGLTYKWQESINGGAFLDVSNGGVYAGADGDTLKLMKPPYSFNGRQYRCVVTNSCPPAATSAAMTQNVLLDKHVTAQPIDVYILPGKNTIFGIKQIGTATSVVWQVDDGKGYVSIDKNGPIYYNYNTDTLTVKGVTPAIDGYRYRALVYGGCMPGPIASYGAKLIVGNTSVPGVQGAAPIVIYPNPAHSVLHVDAPDGSKAVITTVDGKLLLQGAATKDGFNISSFADGMYLIKVTDKEGAVLGVSKFTKTSH